MEVPEQAKAGEELIELTPILTPANQSYGNFLPDTSISVLDQYEDVNVKELEINSKLLFSKTKISQASKEEAITTIINGILAES